MASDHVARKALLGCGLGLVAVLAGFAILSPSEPPGRRPEIVLLISLDTVRADHLACYGHPFIETPNLDALAVEGVRFADVTAPAPTTLASHTSMMTGTYPHTHGVPRNGFVVHQDNHMLAEVFREAGFTTAGFLGSFALERRFGFDQGFDHFDERFDLESVTHGVDQNQRRAEQVTDAVLNYLDQSRARRLLLFVHYFDAHAPYDPPAPFDIKYAAGLPDASGSLPEIEQAVVQHQAAVLGEPLGQARVLGEGLTPELVRAPSQGPLGRDEALAARYCGEISYLDHHVGRLIADLKRRGVYEDATIAVTSDHGETMWEHGDFWNHGLWVYDTTVRVPLILRLPKDGERGRVVDTPVSGIDLMPTLLSLAGLGPPAVVEGRDLTPLLRGQPLDRGEVFSEATQPFRGIESSEGWRNAQKPKALRSGKWKYIVGPYLRLEELYDLESDPGERRNLLAEGDAGDSQLHSFREQVQQWHQAARPLPSDFDATHYQETLERLRSLGYVGGQ